MLAEIKCSSSLNYSPNDHNQMDLDVTKPVFGVSDKASFKSVSLATETS